MQIIKVKKNIRTSIEINFFLSENLTHILMGNDLN